MKVYGKGRRSCWRSWVGVIVGGLGLELGLGLVMELYGSVGISVTGLVLGVQISDGGLGLELQLLMEIYGKGRDYRWWFMVVRSE